MAKEIVAKLNSLRIAPRKVRLVAGLVRGKSVAAAKQQLAFLPKRSAEPIMKLIDSAVANAKNNLKIKETDLIIETISVNEGRALKRWLPRAFGRVSPLRKKSSHITLVLKSK
jgi:large subunit ribosomal protein L22